MEKSLAIGSKTGVRLQLLPEVDDQYNDHPVVPLSLYTCETLVPLRLHGATLVNAKFVSLPCLKIIHLEDNILPNEATLEKLILGSPVLEDLTLIRLSTDNATVLQVRSKTLKRVHVNEFTKVVIDAPLLEFLKTKVYNTKNFKIINSDFFAKVDISVNFNRPRLGLIPDRLANTTVIRDILTDISRVKDLVIESATWEVILLYTQPGPLPQFPNLSCLDAKFTYSHAKMLPTLLDSCPKLESLVLELEEDPYHVRCRKKRTPKMMFSTVPVCLVSSLKFVELKRPIMGYKGEMNLIS
ncbi:F-box/FBD/LRR-repeat protein At1g51370 [Capsella rubella]|uniref:F-box/FBD/LRR-repeat protein At1g51370 n=1 Tax=Capsella rubella TaxID=81985 RepID=UPI000CD4DA01|nr:F-box/FBD/LRR-repeat protein At1g51370 [Capsella rubella]